MSAIRAGIVTVSTKEQLLQAEGHVASERAKLVPSRRSSLRRSSRRQKRRGGTGCGSDDGDLYPARA